MLNVNMQEYTDKFLYYTLVRVQQDEHPFYGDIHIVRKK